MCAMGIGIIGQGWKYRIYNLIDNGMGSKLVCYNENNETREKNSFKIPTSGNIAGEYQQGGRRRLLGKNH